MSKPASISKGNPRRDRPRGVKGGGVAATSLPSLFMRMFVSRLGMLMCEFAMFVSRVGVLLPLFVFADIVMMGGLMMMMGGCVVMSRRLMMVLTGRMLRGLCHWPILPTRRPHREDAGSGSGDAISNRQFAIVVAGAYEPTITV